MLKYPSVIWLVSASTWFWAIFCIGLLLLLLLFCSSLDCTLPSAAAGISAVTAGTHPASAAMLSYSILPECVYVCVCVVLCVKVSKCFLTEASSLSVNKWVGHSHDLHFILYVSLFLPLNCSTFLHIQSIYTCPSLSRHKEHQCLLYNVFPSQHACSEVPPALILKK